MYAFLIFFFWRKRDRESNNYLQSQLEIVPKFLAYKSFCSIQSVSQSRYTYLRHMHNFVNFYTRERRKWFFDISNSFGTFRPLRFLHR